MNARDKETGRLIPALVPAFETSIGLPEPEGAPILVDKRDLDRLNQEIKEEHAPALRYATEAANTAALFAKRAIRPDEIAALRRSMFTVVTKGLTEVDQVIMGKKTWTPAQTRLFSILVERVMPKLSNIVVQDDTNKKLEEYSMEELEAIALGKKKAGAVDAVMSKAEALDTQADKVERRQMKREVVAQLAHIDSLDAAEKRYIAEQAARPLKDIEADAGKKVAKFQPKFNAEQIARVRAARKRGPKQAWIDKGLAPEEVEELDRQRIERALDTKEQLKQEKLERIGVKMGLGDAEQVAIDLNKFKRKTLAEFRVHPAKGVRSQTKIVREQQARQAKAQKIAEKEANAKIRVTGLKGIPEGVTHMKISELRALRPELFTAKGTSRDPEVMARLDAEEAAAEAAKKAADDAS